MLVAQLTDPHVMPQGVRRRLMGDTLAHLERAVAWINGMNPPVGAVVVTGDLTDGAQHVEYARLRGALDRLRPPYYLLPGNHDRGAALREVFAGSGYLPADGPIHYAVDRGGVRIVALDTTARGRAGGFVDDDRLAWLRGALADSADRATLLCMHHPPFRTGMHYMDAFGFEGVHALREVVADHPQVALVVAGHVHRAFATQLGATALWTSVSTAPQVVPEVLERRPFWLRFERPGLSLHRWDARLGRFDSQLFVRRGRDYAQAPKAVTRLSAAQSQPGGIAASARIAAHSSSVTGWTDSREPLRSNTM